MTLCHDFECDVQMVFCCHKHEALKYVKVRQLTYFICLTIVLFPDSPAPATQTTSITFIIAKSKSQLSHELINEYLSMTNA